VDHARLFEGFDTRARQVEGREVGGNDGIRLDRLRQLLYGRGAARNDRIGIDRSLFSLVCPGIRRGAEAGGTTLERRL